VEPCLPQHDPRPGPRFRRVAAACEAYRYEHQGPIAFLEHLPRRDDFPRSYRLKRTFTALRFGLDVALVRLQQAWRRPSFEEHARYYPLFRRKPAVIRRFEDDAVFAWQRVAGANPLDLRRLTEPLPDFPLDDALFAANTRPGSTLAREIDEGRVFAVDHSDLGALSDVVNQRDLQRWLVAPKMLFWYSPDGLLLPVAIQLQPRPGPDNPIYTPRDGADWRAAKIFAQSGDTTAQEMRHHLAQTHLVLEPVAIASKRQLAPNHPVRLLLDAHLESLLAINDFGRRTLIAPGGFLDQLMPGWLSETMQVVGDAVAGWSWRAGGFHEDLEARGLDDLPDGMQAPFRDDGRLVWDAIHAFVSAYVRLYYGAAEDVRLDAELQRFVEEASREGRARGLPMALHTVDEVVDLLVRIVWVSGPKHAAVNYAQWDYVAYVPNMPFAMYREPPTGKGAQDWTLDALAAALPAREPTLKQILLMEALTGWQHTTLGRYRRGAFRDRRVWPLVREFQRALAGIEDTIRERDRERLLPYPYLRPSRIPNSTNT